MSLFREGNFDTLEFMIPSSGMNQNISPKLLPPNNAYVLDNIIPLPIGRGQVRYGTNLINGGLAADSFIMEIFPYLKADASEQLILYVNDYINDASTNTYVVNAVNSITFTTATPSLYVADTIIKIFYHTAAFPSTPVYCNIDTVTVAGFIVTIVFSENYFVQNIGGIIIDSVWPSVGNVYSYTIETSTLSAPLNASYMSAACIPRSVTFVNTLVMCNGIDKLTSWDGTTFKIVTDYVTEIANVFNRLSSSSFTFVPPPNFIIGKYPVGGAIQLTVNGAVTNLIINTITNIANLVTITTTTATVPAFTGVDIVTVAYADFPPPFNFLFVAHARLWALGTGAATNQYRVPSEAMVVYYANQENSVTDWFDEATKVVELIDISLTHGIPDNLEAIVSLSTYVAFIGRHKTQVWQGNDPTVDAADPNVFSWAYNLNIGIAHGNLAIDLSTDTYLVSDSGVVSLSRFNITQQIGATDANAVDPIVREYLLSIKGSNIFYFQCRSFKYKNGPFCGFKIGANNVLVSLYSVSLYSWMFFSGDFGNASTIAAGAVDSLYLGVGNKLYKYADGKDGGNIYYADQNNTAVISFWWTLPVVHQPGVRYANKRYEIQMEYGSAFERNVNDQVTIGIYGDLRKTFNLTNLNTLAPIGDALNTVPLGLGLPNPIAPDPALEGMRLDQPYAFIQGRLKFISSSFWLYINGYTTDGPIYFDRIRLFGILERRS